MRPGTHWLVEEDAEQRQRPGAGRTSQPLGAGGGQNDHGREDKHRSRIAEITEQALLEAERRADVVGPLEAAEDTANEIVENPGQD